MQTNATLIYAIGQIVHHLQRQQPIEPQLWDMLEEAIKEEYPQFVPNLFSVVRPTLIQYRVCLLIKAGFRPMEIARAVGRSKSAVSNMRHRLYQRVYPKGSKRERNWDEFILNL